MKGGFRPIDGDVYRKSVVETLQAFTQRPTSHKGSCNQFNASENNAKFGHKRKLNIFFTSYQVLNWTPTLEQTNMSKRVSLKCQEILSELRIGRLPRFNSNNCKLRLCFVEM